MYEIKKLQISSVAKISGIASGLVGLIPMAFSLFFYLTRIVDYEDGSGYGGFELIGSLFIFAIPLASALLGYIYGVVIAFIYNLIVPYVGGIRMEIELIEERGDQKENQPS